MKHLHNANRIPYGGAYVINLPEQGMVGYGMNFPALLKSIKEWRRANSWPVGLEFEAEVENVICRKYPDECDEGIISKPRKTKLSLATVLRGTKVLLAFKLAGSPYVSQDEANARAAICSACAFNQEYAKPCGGNCGGLKEVVSAIVGNQHTPYDDQLKSCGICGCVSRAHIWLPLSFLEKGLTSDMKQSFNAVEHCWKKV